MRLGGVSKMTSRFQQLRFRIIADPLVRLAFELYGQFSAPENTVLSPLGIYCVLAMLYEGAGGESRDALSRLLPREPGWSLASEIDVLLDELHSRTQLTRNEIKQLKADEEQRADLVSRGEWNEWSEFHYGTATAQDVRLELLIANGLWIQDTYACKPEFVEAVRSQMSGKIEHLDLECDPVHSCRVINDWISEETRGRIGPVLSPADLGPLRRLILASALYFKARWENIFGEPRTGPFYLLDGSVIEAQMMSTEYWGLNYVQTDSYWAVELPYYRRPVSMVVIVPSSRGLEAFLALERGFSHYWNAFRLDKPRRRQRVILTMPEFQITANYELSSRLSGMGLRNIFGQNADFSGISDERGLGIDAILHNTYISVNPYGTEAAAATLGVMIGASPPEEIVILTVDRPFLFVIVDKPTGVPVFLGKVTNPV